MYCIRTHSYNQSSSLIFDPEARFDLLFFENAKLETSDLEKE
jgi:hypothetical protein